MSEYRKYQRTQVAEIAEWTPDFDMTGVSISEPDRKAGSPKAGDGIARNPDNHNDRWLIAADYRAKNFAPMVGSDQNIDKIVEQAINETPTIPYQPGITNWERQMDYADKVARRAAELAVAKERERCAICTEDGMTNKTEWCTSGETMAVAWPINVMDGAEWNILDSTGTRIAVCGYDGADQSHPTPNAQDCYGSGRRIGWAIVGMIRNLKTKADFLEEQFAESERVRKILDDALTDIQVAVAPTSALPEAVLYTRIMAARTALAEVAIQKGKT